MDNLLDAKFGRLPGLLCEPGEAPRPADPETIEKAEAALRTLLGSILPTPSPTITKADPAREKIDIHTHAGRHDVQALMGAFGLSWSEKISLADAVRRAARATGVDRSTVYRWVKAVDRSRWERLIQSMDYVNNDNLVWVHQSLPRRGGRARIRHKGKSVD